MNEYDSNRIYDLAKEIDYHKERELENIDCYVLNTCHIREKATEKVYHDIGRLKKIFRNKKKPIVIVTGCVAQAEGEIILKREKYIDAVLGPQSYHKLNETIINLEKKIEKINCTEFNVVDKFDKLNITKNSDSNTSTFLTIQEGCDKFCKFCVVPYTRGPEFSRSIDELMKEGEVLVKNGAREITLLGQNVNAYNFKGKKLSELIRELSKIKNLKRIRYTTSHPIDFSNDLIKIHAEIKKLMPLIHLPIQSGSNKILKSMNRKHTVEDYLDIVGKLKKINNSIQFSSDFIIGYPGETEKDFDETLKLLKKVKFINSFSFIFSARPGTPAFKMAKINHNVAKDRLVKFQKVAEDIRLNYKKSLFNTKSNVLFENQIKGSNEFFGRDEFSNSVIVKSNQDITGSIKDVKIINGNQTTLYGDIKNEVQKKEFAA